MGADLILSRLEHVQRSGKGWRTACPACGGRSRKLSLSEADDGRLLLHCFGGCDAAAVVVAAGLTIGDLFPERLAADTPDERKRRARLARESQWGAALDMLALESMVVLIAARQLAAWLPLTEEDEARLIMAHQRIEQCRDVLRNAPRWNPKAAAA